MLTFGLGFLGADAPGEMALPVPTGDAELLTFIADVAKSLRKFAAVSVYTRESRARHTAEQYPALILFPDAGNDRDQPNPGTALRVLRFIAVVETRGTTDQESGPKAFALAKEFQDLFNADRSFGGRCVGRMSMISDAIPDEAMAPAYRVACVGQVSYSKDRRA